MWTQEIESFQLTLFRFNVVVRVTPHPIVRYATTCLVADLSYVTNMWLLNMLSSILTKSPFSYYGTGSPCFPQIDATGKQQEKDHRFVLVCKGDSIWEVVSSLRTLSGLVLIYSSVWSAKVLDWDGRVRAFLELWSWSVLHIYIDSYIYSVLSSTRRSQKRCAFIGHIFGEIKIFRSEGP